MTEEPAVAPPCQCPAAVQGTGDKACERVAVETVLKATPLPKGWTQKSNPEIPLWRAGALQGCNQNSLACPAAAVEYHGDAGARVPWAHYGAPFGRHGGSQGCFQEPWGAKNHLQRPQVPPSVTKVTPRTALRATLSDQSGPKDLPKSPQGPQSHQSDLQGPPRANQQAEATF